jgi:AcrR family transcriptional regulator
MRSIAVRSSTTNRLDELYPPIGAFALKPQKICVVTIPITDIQPIIAIRSYRKQYIRIVATIRRVPGASEENLTAYARIRNAALELFAARGAAGTTIREVARVAGVSPGLVQHHFGTKAGLQKAVDEFVVADALSTITGLPEPLEERSAEFASRMGAVTRDRPAAVLYLARAASEGTDLGRSAFKEILDHGVREFRAMEEAGQLGPELDLEWAVLQMLLFNLSTIMFEPAIEHALGESIMTEEGRRRVNDAARRLFTVGFTKTPAPRARRRSREGRR